MSGTAAALTLGVGNLLGAGTGAASFVGKMAMESAIETAAMGLYNSASGNDYNGGAEFGWNMIGNFAGEGIEAGLGAIGRNLDFGSPRARGGDLDTPPARANADADTPIMRCDACVCGQNSFSADTLVSTPDGEMPISEIEVGDKVLAYNEETGTTGEYTVTATMQHEDETIVTLTVNGEEIEITPWHLFYTNEGWVEAGDLEEGDLLLSLGGIYGTVEAILIEDRIETMYDLTVEEVHTFAVGDGDWVVHNENSLKKSCYVPMYALGNIGDADATRTLNQATLQLYEPNGHTFFSGVYELDSGRWLAYPSGETKLASGEIPSIRVQRAGGHREVWHSWSQFDPLIMPRELPHLWDPPVESGLVGFTLAYTKSEGLISRFRSVSINMSSWLSQEAPNSVQVFDNYLVKPGEWVYPRFQVMTQLPNDIGLPIRYISNSLDG